MMPDADLDNVVSSLLGAAFGSSGERCMALSVAVAVGDEIADQMIAKLSEAMSSLKNMVLIWIRITILDQSLQLNIKLKL